MSLIISVNVDQIEYNFDDSNCLDSEVYISDTEEVTVKYDDLLNSSKYIDNNSSRSLSDLNNNNKRLMKSEFFVGVVENDVLINDSSVTGKYETDNNIIKMNSNISEIDSWKNNGIYHSKNNSLERKRFSLLDSFDLEIEVSVAANDYKLSVDVPPVKLERIVTPKQLNKDVFVDDNCYAKLEETHEVSMSNELIDEKDLESHAQLDSNLLESDYRPKGKSTSSMTNKDFFISEKHQMKDKSQICDNDIGNYFQIGDVFSSIVKTDLSAKSTMAVTSKIDDIIKGSNIFQVINKTGDETDKSQQSNLSKKDIGEFSSQGDASFPNERIETKYESTMSDIYEDLSTQNYVTADEFKSLSKQQYQNQTLFNNIFLDHLPNNCYNAINKNCNRSETNVILDNKAPKNDYNNCHTSGWKIQKKKQYIDTILNEIIRSTSSLFDLEEVVEEEEQQPQPVPPKSKIYINKLPHYSWRNSFNWNNSSKSFMKFINKSLAKSSVVTLTSKVAKLQKSYSEVSKITIEINQNSVESNRIKRSDTIK